MDFAQRRGDRLDIGKLLTHLVDHGEKDVWIQFRFGRIDFRSLDAQTHLQVFLVADQNIDFAGDPAKNFLTLRRAA
jgi:hypothetical protein